MLDCYLMKADQCERLAKAALDLSQRAKFETERRLWLEPAEAETVVIKPIQTAGHRRVGRTAEKEQRAGYAKSVQNGRRLLRPNFYHDLAMDRRHFFFP